MEFDINLSSKTKRPTRIVTVPQFVSYKNDRSHNLFILRSIFKHLIFYHNILSINASLIYRRRGGLILAFVQ